MKEIIGVRFRPNGKIYYFDPQNFEVEAGSFVIVETARGVEYGKVVLGRREVEEGKITASLKPIIRIATEDDTRRYEDNKKKSKRAFGICLEKIAKHKLDMKLIEAEYTFDNNKVLFYFTADRRIDFRELVKDLASVFKTRIELRQIGVRDETKMVGGIGICGRELCCNKHLSEFVPVSIKMAKEQNLSLNPTKISGVCGRLMCCLKHEQDTYEYLNEKLPNVGDFVRTIDGNKGEVMSVNVLRQKVKIVVTDKDDNKEVMEYPVAELKFKPKRRKNSERLSAESTRHLRHWRTRVESPNLTIKPDVVIKPDERIDDLQCRGYQIIQNSGMFCFGMDAVLLANYVRFKRKGRYLDLGTGTGIIPILLAAKEYGEGTLTRKERLAVLDAIDHKIASDHPEIKRGLTDAKPADNARFIGIELQTECADMAARSVSLNGLDGLVRIDNGDIKEVSCNYKKASFDIVTSNPPYIKGSHGLENPGCSEEHSET